MAKKPLSGRKRKSGFDVLHSADMKRYETLFAHMRGDIWRQLDYFEPGFTKRLETFAEEAGLSVGTVRKIMDGAHRENPQFLTVFKLARALGYLNELMDVFRKTNAPVTRAEAKREAAASKRRHQRRKR